jgi:hypothetical protein
MTTRVSCYLKKGIVYVETLGAIETGGFVGIEPIAVLPVSNSDGLRQAFKEVFARGNPIEPSRLRADIPPPPILKYAKAKTWGEFARGTQPWTIRDDKDGSIKIVGHRKAVPYGWEADPAQIVSFPSSTNEDQIIDRMIDILQSAAKKPKAAKH